MKHPASTYRQFSIQGATPLGLIVMLYDGAIAAMQRAVAAIEAHDVPKKCLHLNRALAIIAQLEGTLNFEVGGEVAQTLKSLYSYTRAQLLKANIENSSRTLQVLIEKLMPVREAWHEADRRPSPSAPASAPNASPEVSASGGAPRPRAVPLMEAGEESPQRVSPPGARGSLRMTA